MKREVPVITLFVTGLLIIADRYFKIATISSFSKGITDWGVIISGFALGIAAINLLIIHGRNIRSGKNTIYSATLMVSLVGMACVGVVGGVSSWAFSFLYDSLMAPMAAAMFAMAAFYVASAAYRAFVARNLDATILLVTAVIIMLGQTSLGELLHPKFGLLSEWVINVPNLASQRGLMIGSAIGAVTISLRVLVGLDRGHFGGGE